ncbi:hypothetical protein, partial [Neosynechococcus sphagnicola]|uniref:hypothetical protein n=1 Tax=Neosynechococcus sphagnicola TaxID=1501145 RepID=UPI00056408B1
MRKLMINGVKVLIGIGGNTLIRHRQRSLWPLLTQDGPKNQPKLISVADYAKLHHYHPQTVR